MAGRKAFVFTILEVTLDQAGIVTWPAKKLVLLLNFKIWTGAEAFKWSHTVHPFVVIVLEATLTHKNLLKRQQEARHLHIS